MSTPTKPTPHRSPLAGLAVGVLLTIILFPAVRQIFTTTGEAVIGAVVGALLASFVYTLASVRR